MEPQYSMLQIFLLFVYSNATVLVSNASMLVFLIFVYIILMYRIEE